MDQVTPPRHPAFWLVSLLLLCQVFLGATAGASTAVDRRLVENGGYIISLRGHVLDSHRPDELFAAASTFKILSALAVINTLGLESRFVTTFSVDHQNTLYLRGSGDPFLTSEYLRTIAATIAKSLPEVSAIVIDDSFFQLEQPLPPGSENSPNPYDAGNGAAAVNFNSVAIKRATNGSLTSGESQTPLTSLAKEIGARLPAGNHRVNVSAYPTRGTLAPQLRQTAELLRLFLIQAGVHCPPLYRRGEQPPEATLLVRFESPRTIRDLLTSCLAYSSNFMANQLVLAAAANRYGKPATWEKARLLLAETATAIPGLSRGAIEIAEASGLSRDNRISPRALLHILAAFEPYKRLLPRRQGGFLKSGTMRNIYCYAGYYPLAGEDVAVVLLLNQTRNTRDAALRTLLEQLPRQSPGIAAVGGSH